MSVTEAVQQSVHLEGIGQIAISVADLERSKDFYGNKLGLAHLFDAGVMSFYRCGQVRLLIGFSDKPVATGGMILYFRVANIDEVCSVLGARGVEFVQGPHLVAKMTDHDLWMAFLHDPDRHLIGLMSEKPHVAA
jgi:methylmalonyl-CoA/ethylmalonyl-CoA epimerase